MGILRVLKQLGKGALKAAELSDHPLVVPLSVALPYGWFKVGITAMRAVNKTAKEIQAQLGIDMNDEQKRAQFAEKVKAMFPEASDSDISLLGSLVVKLEKQGDAD